jgi:hypothetical protein
MISEHRKFGIWNFKKFEFRKFWALPSAPAYPLQVLALPSSGCALFAVIPKQTTDSFSINYIKY